MEFRIEMIPMPVPKHSISLSKGYIQQLSSEMLQQLFNAWTLQSRTEINPEYWKSRCELPNAL